MLPCGMATRLRRVLKKKYVFCVEMPQTPSKNGGISEKAAKGRKTNFEFHLLNMRIFCKRFDDLTPSLHPVKFYKYDLLYMHTRFTLLFVALVALSASAQDTITISIPERQDAITCELYIPPPADLVGTRLKVPQFHQGIFYDWHQLWQGRTAGLTVVRPGSDPNQNFNVRARGLHTLHLRTDPLYVVDGVPGISMQSLDPADIVEVNILRDGVGMARYGGRGSAGVVEVKTRRAPDNMGKFWVNYHAQAGTELAEKLYTVTSRDAFIAFGGADVTPNEDTDTDWQREVVRPLALNHAHHLNIGARYLRHGIVTARLHYRGHQGILQESQFGQLNGSVLAEYGLLDNTLRISAGVNLHNRRSELGFEEAYRYAVTANPTAPIRTDNLLYGGYYELGIFDAFNPVAMIEQNTSRATRQYLMAHAQATWQILPSLSAEVRLANERSRSLGVQYYSPQSLWRGEFAKGRGISDQRRQDQLITDALIRYHKLWKGLGVTARGGYTFQDVLLQSNGWNLNNVQNISPNGWDLQQFRKDLIAQYDAVGVNTLEQKRQDDLKNRYVSLWGQFDANYRSMFFLSTGLRRDGASALGPDTRTRAFPYVEMGWDLARHFDQNTLLQLRIGGSWAQSGQAPDFDDFQNLSFYVGGLFQFQNDSTYVPTATISYQFSDGLRYEVHTERALTVDWNLWGSLRGQLAVYNAKSTDLLMPENRLGAGTAWSNQAEISNRGIELTLNYEVFNTNQFEWNTGFVASRNRTVLTAVGQEDSTVISFLGAPGNCCGGYGLLYNGTPLGQFYGSVTLSDEVDGSGSIPLTDLNGDGFAFSNDIRDMRPIGQAQPRWELGWHNTFRYKGWRAGMSFRAVIGHDMVNDMYYNYGTNSDTKSAYNRVITRAFNDKLTGRYSFSDYFVERATFLRLQQIYVERDLNSRFSITLGANNLLTWTRYSGLDPELQLTDRGATSGGSQSGSGESRYMMGIERRNSIPAARALHVGVRVRL
jgi:TonB-dependent starch-binding outer membrane protein SusC